MGVLGEVEVVGSGIEDVALLVLVVIAGEVVFLDVDGDDLGSVGLKDLFRLGKSAQDHVGLLDLSLLIGNVDEDLGNALSGEISGVGDLDLEVVDTRLFVVGRVPS